MLHDAFQGRRFGFGIGDVVAQSVDRKQVSSRVLEYGGLGLTDDAAAWAAPPPPPPLPRKIYSAL